MSRCAVAASNCARDRLGRRLPDSSLVSLHAATKGRPKSHLRLARQARPALSRRAGQRRRDRHQCGQGARLLDRPIGNDGLRWNDLQQWWGRKRADADATQAKRSLYARLQASLPRNSRRKTCCSMPSSRGFAVRCPTCRRCCGDLAALGPTDGQGARSGCASAVSHGLFCPANRACGGHRGRRQAPLRRR